MITYESLKELAMALSKVTNKRYVAFESFDDGYEINVSVCDEKMIWNKPSKGEEYWDNNDDVDYFTFCSGEYVQFDFDWSKCQFDCKETKNDR